MENIFIVENLPGYLDVKSKEDYIKLLDSLKRGDEFVVVSLSDGIQRQWNMDYKPQKAIFVERINTSSAGMVYEFQVYGEDKKWQTVKVWPEHGFFHTIPFEGMNDFILTTDRLHTMQYEVINAELKKLKDQRLKNTNSYINLALKTPNIND